MMVHCKWAKPCSVYGAVMLLVTVGCGRNLRHVKPVERASDGGSQSGDSRADPKEAPDDKPTGEDDQPQEAKNESNTEGSGESAPLTIDGASADEIAIADFCLKKFENHPFSRHITAYRKIVPLPSLNEDKVVIDDQKPSVDPTLVVIVDGINIGGTVTFRLLDPNGFYCVKPGALVRNLIVQLDCKARIADGNDQKGKDSIQGVYISAVTKFEKVDPGRGDCIR